MNTIPTPQRVTEWQSHYQEIRTELLDLFVGRTVLWRMIKILGRKGRPPQYGIVLGAVQLAYAHYGALAVRRLADRRHGTRSLYKLLEQIAGHPTELSRSWFLSQWNPDLSEIAQRNFDRLAGKGKPHLVKWTVNDDLRKLRDRTAKIEQWVNNFVAHRAARPAAGRPTFRDLRMAIEAVIRINNKYAELLVQPAAMMPVIPEPWDSVFYAPLLRRRWGRRGSSIRGARARRPV